MNTVKEYNAMMSEFKLESAHLLKGCAWKNKDIFNHVSVGFQFEIELFLSEIILYLLFGVCGNNIFIISSQEMLFSFCKWKHVVVANKNNIYLF